MFSLAVLANFVMNKFNLGKYFFESVLSSSLTFLDALKSIHSETVMYKLLGLSSPCPLWKTMCLETHMFGILTSVLQHVKCRECRLPLTNLGW